jgi:hypothetical protein
MRVCSTMKIQSVEQCTASFIAEFALVIRLAKSQSAILIVTIAGEPSMSSCFVFFSLCLSSPFCTYNFYYFINIFRRGNPSSLIKKNSTIR